MRLGGRGKIASVMGMGVVRIRVRNRAEMSGRIEDCIVLTCLKEECHAGYRYRCVIKYGIDGFVNPRKIYSFPT